MKRIVLAFVLVAAAVVFAMQAIGTSAETLTFTSAVVAPAGACIRFN